MEWDIKERATMRKARTKVRRRQTRSLWKWQRGAGSLGEKYEGVGCPKFNHENVEEHSRAFWSINLADGTSAIKRDNAEWVSRREERSRWKVWKLLLLCEGWFFTADNTERKVPWERQLNALRVFVLHVNIALYIYCSCSTCPCVLCLCGCSAADYNEKGSWGA